MDALYQFHLLCMLCVTTVFPKNINTCREWYSLHKIIFSWVMWAPSNKDINTESTNYSICTINNIHANILNFLLHMRTSEYRADTTWRKIETRHLQNYFHHSIATNLWAKYCIHMAHCTRKKERINSHWSAIQNNIS